MTSIHCQLVWSSFSFWTRLLLPLFPTRACPVGCFCRFAMFSLFLPPPLPLGALLRCPRGSHGFSPPCYYKRRFPRSCRPPRFFLRACSHPILFFFFPFLFFTRQTRLLLSFGKWLHYAARIQIKITKPRPARLFHLSVFPPSVFLPFVDRDRFYSPPFSVPTPDFGA